MRYFATPAKYVSHIQSALAILCMATVLVGCEKAMTIDEQISVKTKCEAAGGFVYSEIATGRLFPFTAGHRTECDLRTKYVPKQP